MGQIVIPKWVMSVLNNILAHFNSICVNLIDAKKLYEWYYKCMMNVWKMEKL